MANGSNKNKKKDKIMTKYRFLLVIAAIASIFTACQDDDIVRNSNPAEVGEEILFGARAGFENANPGSRTEYAGETYEIDGVVYERIKWVSATDKIHIYSPQASNPGNVSGNTDMLHSAHYTVTRNDDEATTNNDEAYLQRIGDTSLQWGTGSDEAGTHTFYAMYPSNQMFFNNDGTPAIPAEYADGITMSSTAISGYIHNEQIAKVKPPTEVDGKKHYVASPDMRYAYMVAKTTAARTQDGVNLTFFPIVTALELELKLQPAGAGETVLPVTIAQVSVSANNIAGAFTCDISDGNWETTDGVEKFTGNIISTDSWPRNNEITIITTDPKNNMPLTLNAGESLKFTVFMKPVENIKDIKVSVISDMVGLAKKSKTLTDVEIIARKKNIFTGIKLPTVITSTEEPEEEPIDYSNWMEQINPTTMIKELSLPGTGNSFSNMYKGNNNNYKAQALTFDEQWEAGIRAFEIATDRNLSYSNDLGTVNVECGKESVGIKVNAVVDSLLKKLEDNPYETAMIIFTYQPSGNGRNGNSYMVQLNNYINTKFNGSVYENDNVKSKKAYNSDKLVLFTPDLQMGDYADEDIITNENGSTTVKEGAVSTGARGKLMIVVRPNQLDEKDRNLKDSWLSQGSLNNEDHWNNIKSRIDGTTEKKVLVVNGCGTGRDKWAARGYKMKQGDEEAKYLPYISNSFDDRQYIEYFMANNTPIFGDYDGDESDFTYTTTLNGQTYTLTRPAKDDPAALHFDYTTNQDFACWFQEWYRVVENNIAYSSWNNKLYWFESYREKLSNVKTTFDMAVSGSYPNYTFINSLCGYLANSSPNESIKPSTGSTYGGEYGDIKALATKLNQAFYEYVLEKRAQMVAPTGVVLMDFVNNKEEAGNEGAYWLPQLIIGNNKNNFNDNVITEPDEDPEPDDNDKNEEEENGWDN